MRGSREISLVPSLHRASTDALTWATLSEGAVGCATGPREGEEGKEGRCAMGPAREGEGG